MKTAILLLALGCGVFAGVPAGAEMTRVTQLPASNVFSLTANRDTILAGTDTCVFVSTDAGTNWRASSRVVAGTPLIVAVHMTHGRIFAGTANQGVFVSGDLGATWSAFNQGLAGGILDSQLDIGAFASQGDNLFVATLGAGVYVRPLVAGGVWQHFGEAFEPQQASVVQGLGTDGVRLLAAAGSNGMVFRIDPGDPDWTESFLDNVGLSPSVQAYSAVWNGHGWVVGTGVGVFHSATGQEPWAISAPNFGPIRWLPIVTSGRALFAAFDRTNDFVLASSVNDGQTWDVLEVVPFRLVFALAMSRDVLYAARQDGLFRSTIVTSVSDGAPSADLHFSLVGPQPARDEVRFRIETSSAGEVQISIYDVTGRRVANPVHSFQPAGTHDLAWDARSLEPGVYFARLTAGSRRQDLRIVHVR